MDAKLHTPEGVKDYLPYEAAFKTEIERNIETVFYRYGFLPAVLHLNIWKFLMETVV